MTRRLTFFVTLVCALFLVGCQRDKMSEVGFSLPVGDVREGRDAFLYLQCNQCHTIAGEDIPPVPHLDPPYVELGGPTSTVKTYGQLVTAIINPSHDLAKGYAKEVVSENGESKMYNYNRFMTVQQLTDIVRYLQPHYKVIAPNFPLRPYL